MDGSASLLAIDLGLRLGFAEYGEVAPGVVRLRRYGSTHVASRTSLRRAAASLVEDARGVSRVVVEGDRTMARIWERAAAHHGATVHEVAPETWRRVLLVPRDRQPAARAKQAAGTIAAEVVRWSRSAGTDGPPLPRGTLRHDTAEAILIGLWGVLDAGLVGAAELPFPLPTA